MNQLTFFLAAFGLIAAVLLYTAVWPGWILRRLQAGRRRVVYELPALRPAIALTIDDGPDPVTTPQILDVLRAEGASATFFPLSNKIPGCEHILEQMVREGHEIGNHLLDDRRSWSLRIEEFERALGLSHEALSRFGKVRWFRPGSGLLRPTMLDTVQRFGYRVALSSALPFDRQLPWRWLTVRYLLWIASPGAILILHDDGRAGRNTPRVLEELLPALHRRGLQAVSLSELAYGGGSRRDG